MMIVDAVVNYRPHTKLKLYRKFGIAEDAGRPIEAAAYLAEMDAHDIAKAGLVANVVQNGVGGEVLGVHADEVAALVRAHPDRFFGWVGIDPLGGFGTLRYIEYAVRELGFKGVHVYPHWFGVSIDDRRYYPIYAKCAELGVPIAMQAGRQSARSGGKLCAHPLVWDQVAFDFPELKLAALHLGAPWVDDMVSIARVHDNVWIIADGYPPSTWPKSFVDFIARRDWANEDGDRRVIWGTDHPVGSIGRYVPELAALDIDEAQRARLLGGNAVELLGL